MNRRSREATVAVRPGAVETRPSRWSSSKARRTGSRDTPRRAARSSCLMRVPGRRAPLKIAPRISSAARKCTPRREGAGPRPPAFRRARSGGEDGEGEAGGLRGRRIVRDGAEVSGRKQDHPIDLLRVQARIATESRTAARPPDEADAILPRTGADELHYYAVDLVPVGLGAREDERVARSTGDRARRDRIRADEQLLDGTDVARIAHRKGPRRPAITLDVHRIDIESGARKICHPVIVLEAEIVVGHGGIRAAVHEEHGLAVRLG